jgi:membrane protein
MRWPVPVAVSDAARFACLVARRFREDRCTRVAAALSFTTLLALVPLTAVTFAVFSTLPVFKPWMQTVQEFIYGNFVPAAGGVVSSYLQRFAANAGKLTFWGMLFLGLAAMMMLATIEHAFNDIWRVGRRRRHGYRFLAYGALLALGPILVGLSLALTSYIGSLPLFGRQSPLSGFRTFLLGALPVGFELLAFLLLYRVVPNVPVRLKHALLGAVVAVVLFEVAKRGFGQFMVSFSTYRKIYGALAALPVFLAWIFLSWTITLFGAIITAVLPGWRFAASCPIGVAEDRHVEPGPAVVPKTANLRRQGAKPRRARKV